MNHSIYLIPGTIVAVLSMLPGNNKSPEAERLPDHTSIVVIDGCEYIKAEIYSSAPNYCHKGNCSNPIHQQKP